MSKEYIHFLYYDDPAESQEDLACVKVAFDNAERRTGGDSGYDYAISFTTTSEFSEVQAEKLLLSLTPDDYDLNNGQGDDDEEDEDGFPEVFFECERDRAIAQAEDAEWTIEYIRRLERVAFAAFAYYAKSRNKGLYGEPKLAHVLYEELATVNFMKR